MQEFVENINLYIENMHINPMHQQIEPKSELYMAYFTELYHGDRISII